MSDGRAWGFELTSLKLKTLIWPLDTVLLFNLPLEPVSHCFFVLHRINTHGGFVDLQDFSKGFHGHWANNISAVSLFSKISPLEMIGWITVFRCTPCPGSSNFGHSAKITIQRISIGETNCVIHWMTGFQYKNRDCNRHCLKEDTGS